jgi:hypothetical protein
MVQVMDLGKLVWRMVFVSSCNVHDHHVPMFETAWSLYSNSVSLWADLDNASA